MLSEAVVGDDDPREGANQDFTSTTGGLGVASSFACAGVESSLHLFGGVFVGKAAEAYWTSILQLRRGDGSCFEDSQTGRARGDARRADGAIRGLKRKRAGAVAPSDATPRAPEGRAAAQAKAAGQGCTTFVSECSLPTEKGNFRLRAYRYADGVKTHEPVVMVAGQVRGRERYVFFTEAQARRLTAQRGNEPYSKTETNKFTGPTIPPPDTVRPPSSRSPRDARSSQDPAVAGSGRAVHGVLPPPARRTSRSHLHLSALFCHD